MSTAGKMVRAALALGVSISLAAPAMAGNIDNQTVTFAVNEVNEMGVSGNPAALTISTATAGSQPDDATDSTTTYAITTNATGKKITGAIDSVMPTDVTLTVNLAAPTGGSSAGATALSTTAADLVTGVTKVAEGSKTITYTLSATVAAGVVASATRTVTLTMTGG